MSKCILDVHVSVYFHGCKPGYDLIIIHLLLGNLLVIVVFIKRKKLRTVTNFFLGNLAVADFCVGVICVLPNLTIFCKHQWYFGAVSATCTISLGCPACIHFHCQLL